jgi:hypothetical protein
MKIDNQYKKEILVFLQNSSGNKMNLENLASNFKAYDTNTKEIDNLSIRKLYFHLQNLYDSHFIDARSDNLGFLEGSGDSLSVTMNMEYWLTADGHEYTDFITTPLYKKISFKIFEEMGKLFWTSLGAIVTFAITYIWRCN